MLGRWLLHHHLLYEQIANGVDELNHLPFPVLPDIQLYLHRPDGISYLLPMVGSFVAYFSLHHTPHLQATSHESIVFDESVEVHAYGGFLLPFSPFKSAREMIY